MFQTCISSDIHVQNLHRCDENENTRPAHILLCFPFYLVVLSYSGTQGTRGRGSGGGVPGGTEYELRL